MKMRWGLIVFGMVIAVIVAGCTTEVSTKSKADEGLIKEQVTETPEQRGSYSNPASMDEAVVIKTLSGTFEIAVTNCIRGDEANRIVKEANMFNPNPEEGYEYLLVKVRFSYISGKSSYMVSGYSFKAYSDGTGFSPAFVVMPDDMPEFKTVDLMPGGKVEGWIAFTVPENKDVMLAYEYMFEPVGFIRVC
jgi:hypothetical protein